MLVFSAGKEATFAAAAPALKRSLKQVGRPSLQAASPRQHPWTQAKNVNMHVLSCAWVGLLPIWHRWLRLVCLGFPAASLSRTSTPTCESNILADAHHFLLVFSHRCGCST